MSRPLYETAEQREANAKLADHWGGKMGYQLDISPKACLFDYYVRTPLNQWGLAEMRVRSCTKGKHDTFFISATKWKNLTQLSERFHVPLYLVVRWSDGDGYLHWNGQSFGKGWGGRKSCNVRDSYDQEELTQIPIAEFRPF